MTVIPATSAAQAAQPDLSTLPVRVDRRTAAELLTRYYFPTTPRAVESWAMDWLLVCGRATCLTADLFTVAQAKLDAAPPTHTTRRRAA